MHTISQEYREVRYREGLLKKNGVLMATAVAVAPAPAGVPSRY